MTSPWHDVFNTPPAHLDLVWVRRIENRVAYQAQFLLAEHTLFAWGFGTADANGIYTRATTAAYTDTFTNAAGYKIFWNTTAVPPQWEIQDPTIVPFYTRPETLFAQPDGTDWQTIAGADPHGAVIRPPTGFRLSYYTYPTGWTVTDIILQRELCTRWKPRP